MHRTARSRLGPAVALAFALAGCASTRQTVAGWFGEAAPTPTAVAAAQPVQVYYAGVDGLAVYAEASASSKVVGHLAMHEGVTRSRLEHGYAYVTASASGVEGWVDNAQLIWRLPPAASAPKSEPAVPGAGGGAASAGETTPLESVPPTPTSTATPGPQGAPPTAPPTQVSAPASPKSPAPSMFDPY